ncbi:MAG: glycerol-3-phosphate 1-O-acyltransferase PlsY [Acetobacteraceae bacterium]
MTLNLLFLAIIVLSYLCGSIPFGLILTRMGGEGDIRQIGSGNIGATNVLRTGRKGLAALTLLLDGIKGAVPLLALRGLDFSPLQLGLACASVAVMMGHCFPVWLKFRGGKGVATGLGALIALCWPVGSVCCLIWLAVARLSHISSAGALAASAASVILIAPLSMQPLHAPLPIATFIVVLIVVIRHAGNIQRLVAGTEKPIDIDAPPRDKIKI